MNISAIVVGYNEAQHLENSLPKLSFCDEILYFDLGSNDNSIKIAIENNATIIEHEKVISCEWIHTKFYQKTKHNWVLITDPDEIISDDLIAEIKKMYDLGVFDDKKIGCVSAPWIFHFKDRLLQGTVWGGIRGRILLVHNERFDFQPLIHVGRKLKKEFISEEIKFTGNNVIDHYWMTSYKGLIEKHKRYLKNEGEAKYKSGQRTRIQAILLEPLRAFKYSYISKQGFKDAWTGIFLSFFWAWYRTSSLIKLYQYQNRVAK